MRRHFTLIKEHGDENMFDNLEPQCENVLFLQAPVFLHHEMPIEHELEDAAFVVPLSDVLLYFTDRIQSSNQKRKI